MQRVHQLGNADQQHHRREHLAHDDEAEEQVASLEVHARHRVSRRDAAEHRDCRRARGEHDGVEQETQHAAITDILEVAPHPLRRQHVQEIHVRRFRVAAEARNQHHIERIEDEDAQHDDEQIQPAARQRLLQFAAAQIRDRAQQQENRGERNPKHPVRLHRQSAEHIQQVFARAAVIKEIVELRQQRFVLDVAADQQIHLPGERVIDRPRKRRNAKQRNQRKYAGSQIQPLCLFGQLFARQRQRLMACASRQRQRNRQTDQQQAHDVRRPNARHALAVANAL